MNKITNGKDKTQSYESFIIEFHAFSYIITTFLVLQDSDALGKLDGELAAELFEVKDGKS